MSYFQTSKARPCASRASAIPSKSADQRLLHTNIISVTRDRARTDSKESVTRGAANVGIMVAFRALLFICAVLPQRVVRFFASCIGWLAWQFKSKSRRITERNIAIACPELPISDQRNLARASFRQLFCRIWAIGNCSVLTSRQNIP